MFSWILLLLVCWLMCWLSMLFGCVLRVCCFCCVRRVVGVSGLFLLGECVCLYIDMLIELVFCVCLWL